MRKRRYKGVKGIRALEISRGTLNMLKLSAKIVKR